ncbi:MAG: heparan-alpha-glucosaminide N-acetyltransferase domain-containing protein [Bacteroidota bacterium]
MNRTIELDAARGFAILLMVMANAAPVLLIEAELNSVLRIAGSLAAPLFIFLSGLTFNINLKRKKQSLLRNAIILLCSAVFVDLVIWNIVPFSTFDVLYLIALSQLVFYFVKKLTAGAQMGIVLLLFVGWFVFMWGMEYRFEIGDTQIKDFVFSDLNTSTWNDKLKRMIYDGWFPIFPWILVFALGAMSDVDLLLKSIRIPSVIFLNFLVFIVTAIFICSAELQPTREGYIEIFYPVSPLYAVLMGSRIMTLLGLISIFKLKISKLKFLVDLGSKSLFVYILHLVVISFILSQFNPFNLWVFISIIFGFILMIWIVIQIIRIKAIQLIIQRMPKALQILVGL